MFTVHSAHHCTQSHCSPAPAMTDHHEARISQSLITERKYKQSTSESRLSVLSSANTFLISQNFESYYDELCNIEISY